MEHTQPASLGFRLELANFALELDGGWLCSASDAMVHVALPLPVSHPSLSILLPERLGNPAVSTATNESCKQLDAATAALLERYTYEIISGIDWRIPAAQKAKLLDRIAPGSKLRLGLYRDTFPCSDYFKMFCSEQARATYASVRILSVHCDVQPLKGTASTFAVTESTSKAGIRLHGVQIFKWRLRTSEWLVQSIVAWRAQCASDLLSNDEANLIAIS